MSGVRNKYRGNIGIDKVEKGMRQLVAERKFLEVEDLDVYRKLCQLHIEVCELTYGWPKEEKYELGGQVRRSSNSSPAQLAEKNDDRHIRNKIEGVNISRGEAAETIHHLYMAMLKNYLPDDKYSSLKSRYKECIRMLNGLEKTLEQKLPPKDRVWQTSESNAEYYNTESDNFLGWPT